MASNGKQAAQFNKNTCIIPFTIVIFYLYYLFIYFLLERRL